MLSTGKRLDPELLAERLHAAAIRLLRSVRKVDQSSSLNAPRLSALSVIVFAGPISLGDLANAEQVRPPTMTRIVNALLEQALVVKQIDAADRRSVLLSATMKGQKLLIRARKRRTEALAQRVGLLSAEERKALDSVIDLVVELARK